LIRSAVDITTKTHLQSVTQHRIDYGWQIDSVKRLDQDNRIQVVSHKYMYRQENKPRRLKIREVHEQATKK